MKALYSAEEMRTLDRITIEELKVPGIVLMEHAGYKTALAIRETFNGVPQKTAVVCGKGNNGGDGYVIARWLSLWGWDVTVFSLAEMSQLKGDALTNAQAFKNIWGNRLKVVEAEQLKEVLKNFELVVDAIFGTGLNKPAEGKYREAIEAINESGAFVFSVDIPSGLASDTGSIIGPAVKANATATYGGLKRAHMIYPAKELVGKVHLVSIGIPDSARNRVSPTCFLVEEEEVKKLFPKRAATSHKGNFGHLAVLCGSPGKTGAGVMAGNAALTTGCGLVTLFVPESLNIAFEAATLEVMTQPIPDERGFIKEEALPIILDAMDKKSALAVGCGLGTHPSTGRLLEKLIKEVEIPMVIDADGINLLAQNPDILAHKKSPVILTPHPGEFSRLTGISTKEINQKRLELAVEWAKKLDVIMVLKGASTVTATPGGEAFVNPTGNPGMATGGSGDILTGIIGALLAMGIPAETAAWAGVFLHGLAGDSATEELGEYSLKAGDLLGGLKKVLKAWEGGEKVWMECYRTW